MATVFAIGSNGSGQLGIGHREDVSVPKQALFEEENSHLVTRVRAGGNHTLLIASNKVYCSGDSSSGACGMSSESSNLTPHFHEAKLTNETSITAPVIFTAATWEASIIVQRDENGRATQMRTFGTGNKGELAQGELLFRSYKAQLITGFPPQDTEIVDLAACVSHVVAVLSNGDVYGWGSGRKGQLGLPEGIIYKPRKIDGIKFKVTRAVCGREFTYLLGDYASGQHIVLGSDKWGVRSSAPDSIDGWKDVGASWGSIFILQHDGRLISWGRDDHGQLSPPGLPLLSHIAIGSEHALGLTVDGRVLTWGWGEHGNCGPNTINGDVKGKWNMVASSQYLPPGSRIFSIGAGCATSWICVSN